MFEEDSIDEHLDESAENQYDIDTLFLEPEKILDLEELQAWLQLLTAQKKRLEKFLSNPEYTNIEEMTENMEIALGKAQARFNDLANQTPESNGSIKEQVTQFKQRLNKHRKNKKEIRREVLTEKARLIDESLHGRDIAMETALEEIYRLENETAVLKKQVETKAELLGVLGTTNTVLKGLESRAKALQPPTSSNGTTPEGNVSQSELPETMALDLQHLKKIIELANATTQKIRVLSADNHADIFLRIWKQALTNLGFKGTVQNCNYTSLNKTMDFDTPILIPGRMHTHTSKWERSDFPNRWVIRSKPQLLVNNTTRTGT